SRKLVLRPAPGALHDLPWIAGRLRRMDDDRARCALACRALVLVGPPPVIEPLAAAEELRIPVGIVVQHQQNLAAQIGALEVVPVVLGRFDAVADEDDLRVLDRRALRGDAARRDELAMLRELEALAVARERPARRLRRGDTDELERLQVRAVGAGGLEAEPLERRGEIGLRHFVAGRARRTSRVTVACKL